MFFFFSSRRRHTRYWRDWSSDVCSSDLNSPSMMTEARLPNWWIHHMCIVEIWVIWVVGNIGEMGKGRIVENRRLCEVVGDTLRVFLHIAGPMTCTPTIVWIAWIKILREY